jgi:hypothetical protein
MSETGGASTKVLDYLSNGKRTVCTPEAARGIKSPPIGLWIADRREFGDAVVNALAYPWSATQANALRAWMASNYGPDALKHAWKRALLVPNIS